MTQIIKRRCSFAGPNIENTSIKPEYIKKVLIKEIKNAVNDGITTFITGMSKGTDLYAGEIIVDMRDKNKAIKLICISPYKGYGYEWSTAWKQLYNYVWDMADFKKVLSQSYTGPEVYDDKIKYIVSRCERIIAFYDGNDMSDSGDVLRYGQNNESIIKKIMLYAENSVYNKTKEKLIDDKWRVTDTSQQING